MIGAVEPERSPIEAIEELLSWARTVIATTIRVSGDLDDQTLRASLEQLRNALDPALNPRLGRAIEALHGK